ncbi:MAG TPA: phosphopantetheine-binding protein [Solibacterales bacterium]|jgi:acyl carrier protein|nr:phosphopantetheine-binding protein [Bryobacterales bacterium]
MSDALTDRVLRVIAATQRLPMESVTPDKSFEELGIDSMDGVNILFALESEFDISIPDEEARGIQTVGAMIEGVRRLADAAPK